jgi:flagellar hook-associated protein FlgK
LLGRAQTFADQVRSSSDQMQNFRTDLFSQARELTGQINSKLDTVAQLSGRINQARAAGEEPADLEDKRDAELLELSQMVEIHTYTDGNGQLVVQGPGVTLVQSDQARHLSIDIDSDGSLRVLAETAGGNGSEITKFLNAGQLSGILTVRSTSPARSTARMPRVLVWTEAAGATCLR